MRDGCAASIKPSTHRLHITAVLVDLVRAHRDQSTLAVKSGVLKTVFSRRIIAA